jgi:hypothetical protein
MKKILLYLLGLSLLGLPALFASAPARADNKQTDENRLQNAGAVRKEMVHIPEDIPTKPTAWS